MFFGRKKDESREWAAATGSEQRAFPRMGLKTIVGVRVFGREANCRLRDLSLGGLAFIAPWEVTPGDPITISFPGPDGLPRMRRQEVASEGRVCRCVRSEKYDGWQVGVRFIEIPPDGKRLIRLWFETFGESPDGKKDARRPSR